jgi:hypothetical protein
MAYAEARLAFVFRLLTGGVTALVAAGVSLVLASFWTTLASQQY